MSYIEPCCIDKQLPKVMKEAKGGFCFFQTSGDVTLEKLLGAVSRLAGDEHVIVLTVPEVDVMMLRTLAYYFRRGWTQALLLLTQRSQKELVESELSGYLDRVHYAVDPLVLDSQLAIIGCDTKDTKGSGTFVSLSLVIQGAMLSQADFSLSLYAAWLGNDKDVLLQAIDPVIAKLKMKAVIDHYDQACIGHILNREM
ncbi:MAG: hypothetical protein K6F74_05925 [Prevotella sp.]|nr:hypothetical protein [Prevotella sp.]